MSSPDDPLMRDELEALRRVAEEASADLLATYKLRLVMLGYIEDGPSGVRVTERGRQRLDGKLW